MEGRCEMHRSLTEDEVSEVLTRACAGLQVEGRHVVVLIPDGTRHAPIPMLFRLLNEIAGRRARSIDFLIALGTHPAMTPEAVDRLVGLSESERAERFPNASVLNHGWDRPDSLVRVGVIGGADVEELTGGLLCEPIPIDLNRLVIDCDQLIICGPVFPHEVAGFSGGAKYIVPGIAGPEIINFTHWLGALVTSMHTIGVKDTPVRRVIQRAAEFVRQPLFLLAMVLQGEELRGLFCGPQAETWNLAA